MKTRYDRTVYEVARIPDGGKVAQFPLSADARRLSRRLQGLSRRSGSAGRARALAVRLHLGQSRILVAGLAEHPEGRRRSSSPAQTVKVAANQAWFEYLPARVQAPSGLARRLRIRPRLRTCDRQVGRQWPRRRAEQSGRDPQPHRLSRAPLRPAPRPHHHRPAQLSRCETRPIIAELGSLATATISRECSPRTAMKALDGGRAFNGGNPPAELDFGECEVANPQKDAPPQTILGAEQKAWFKDRLRSSTRDLEDLGQFALGTPRLARRSAEPSGRADQALGRAALRQPRRRRLRQRLCRARRNLRSRPRREDHRLCDRLRRSPQFLGRLCSQAPCRPASVRAGRAELRRRLDVESRA